MNDDLQKKRELRDKVKSLQQQLTRASTTCKSLSQEHTKRKYITFFKLNNNLSSLSFLDYIAIIILLSFLENWKNN